MDKPPKFCIECKKNAISHYRSYFCEDCSRDFFEVKKMKKFVIRIDDKYYAGEGETVKRNASSVGWHIHNLGSSSIAVGNREQAKVIEGYTNLKSNWERIHDAMRYNEIDCQKIVIEMIEG